MLRSTVVPLSSPRTSRREGARRRAGRRGGTEWLGRLTVLLTLASGCRDDGRRPDATIPPAAAYDDPSDFTGTWRGEVDGTVGKLEINMLDEGRYRGLFEGQAMRRRYVLLLEQTAVEGEREPMASNRVTFTWQDGHGGRGDGWLLINREDSALTGSSGERGRHYVAWAFIRVE